MKNPFRWLIIRPFWGVSTQSGFSFRLFTTVYIQFGFLPWLRYAWFMPNQTLQIPVAKIREMYGQKFPTCTFPESIFISQACSTARNLLLFDMASRVSRDCCPALTQLKAFTEGSQKALMDAEVDMREKYPLRLAWQSLQLAGKERTFPTRFELEKES